MNLIIKNHLKAFTSNFELQDISEQKVFECFVNWLVARELTDAHIDPREITSSGDDAGIDGLFFLVDGELVTSSDELTGLVNSRSKRELEAEVIFTQSKTSEKFEKSQITNFSDGVFDFLSSEPNFPHGDFLLDRRKLFLDLLELAPRLKNGRPNARAIYATTGLYSREPELKAAFTLLKTKIASYSYFHEIVVEAVDRENIISKAAATATEVVADLPVIEFSPYPVADGIGQAYVALVNAKEFVDKLLKNKDGKLRPFVFEENVRDFLGPDNPVNLKIRDTLNNVNDRKRFGILNNGVTIISPDITYRAKVFTLRNYQIVNGCQTSNVLFEEYDQLDDSVVITAKIVELTDTDIVHKVVKATNSQSKVEDASFLSLQPISKKLEQYFEARSIANPEEPRLFVERRQGQYRTHSLIQSRVFSLKDVFRATAAFWFDKPDLAGRYSAEMLKELPILSGERNREIVFFTSAMAMYKFSLLIAGSRKLPADFSKAKWHLLMCLKYIVLPGSPPVINHKKADDFCEAILQELAIENGFKLFEKAAATITSLGSYDRDRIRNKQYVDELKKTVRGSNEDPFELSGD
jgi:AIPR protein